MEFITGQVYKISEEVRLFTKLPKFKNDQNFSLITVPKGNLVTFISVIKRVNTENNEIVYTKKFIYNDSYVFDTVSSRLSPELYFELILKPNE